MNHIKNMFSVSGKSGKSKTADDTTAILSIAVVIGVLLIILYCLSNKNKQHREATLENYESGNGSDDNAKRLMEIILLPRLPSEDRDYKYLGLFSNDIESSLYLSSDLKRGMWEGPIKNSMPMTSGAEGSRTEVKIKHITLNDNGELMCIDENDKIWFKPNNISDLNVNGDAADKGANSLDKEWRDDWVTDRTFKTSYVMFFEREVKVSDTSNQQTQTQTPETAQTQTPETEQTQTVEALEKYYVIKKEGELGIGDKQIGIYKYVKNDDSRKLEPLHTNITVRIVDNDGTEVGSRSSSTRLIKIFKEADGHLLGLFADNKLRISALKERDFHIKLKNTGGNDDGTPLDFRESHNKNILLDVLYDKNKMMYGIGKVGGNPILLKQTSISYLGEFLPLFKINPKLEDNRTLLSYRDIIYLKNGYSPVNDNRMPTLDDSYMNEKNKDMTEFRKFCKSRHPKNKNNFRLEKQISEFNQKIEDLKQLKTKLMTLDSRKQLQDNSPS